MDVRAWVRLEVMFVYMKVQVLGVHLPRSTAKCVGRTWVVSKNRSWKGIVFNSLQLLFTYNVIQTAKRAMQYVWREYEVWTLLSGNHDSVVTSKPCWRSGSHVFKPQANLGFKHALIYSPGSIQPKMGPTETSAMISTTPPGSIQPKIDSAEASVMISARTPGSTSFKWVLGSHRLWRGI